MTLISNGCSSLGSLICFPMTSKLDIIIVIRATFGAVRTDAKSLRGQSCSPFCLFKSFLARIQFSTSLKSPPFDNI